MERDKREMSLLVSKPHWLSNNQQKMSPIPKNLQVASRCYFSEAQPGLKML